VLMESVDNSSPCHEPVQREKSPLHEAAEAGDVKFVISWLEQHSGIREQDWKDSTELVLSGLPEVDAETCTPLSREFAKFRAVQQVDLSRNWLTEQACSVLSQVLMTAPNLQRLSLAANPLPLFSLGYLATAVIVRGSKGLPDLHQIDLRLLDELQPAAGPPQRVPRSFVFHLRNLKSGVSTVEVAPVNTEQFSMAARRARGRGVGQEAAAACLALSHSLWNFMLESGHSELRRQPRDEPKWEILQPDTIQRIEAALSRILIMDEQTITGSRQITGDFAVVPDQLAPKTIRALKKHKKPLRGVANQLPPVHGVAKAAGALTAIRMFKSLKTKVIT